MSVFLEENNQNNQTQAPSSPSRLLATERNTNRPANKNKTLRLDSPTTLQACNELGLLLEDLKQKPLDEFKDPKEEEAIINLRYNHYLKRYNQIIKDVMATKKKILKRLKNQQIEQEQQQQQQQLSLPKEARSQTAISSYHILPGIGNSTVNKKSLNFLTPLTTLTPMTTLSKSTSHQSADLKDTGEIIGTDESTIQSLNSPVGNFYKTFSDEIEKFNKSKKQQQREAKDVYQEEIKRLKLVESLQERDKKMEEREKKIRLEKKKKEEEKKRIQEDKIERIREIEKNFKIKKQKERELIKQKLEGAQKNYLHEIQEKRRLIIEKETEAQIRMKEAEDKRRRLQEEEIMDADRLMYDLQGKIQDNNVRHQTNLSRKTQRIRVRLDKVEEDVEKNKERQKRLAEEYIQRLVGKLVVKEESIKAFNDKHYKASKNKEVETTMKIKRHHEHQNDIQEKYKYRMKEINERFQKVQENLEHKREVDFQNRKMKGELNRLKLHDKLENHTRLQRRIQFERLRVLDKEKNEQEKVVLLKSYREIARKTKLEVAIHSKVEKDRIKDSVNHLAKLVYLENSSQGVTRSQKKLLKQVLHPDDYQTIEETETRRELERKIALGLIDEMSNPILVPTISVKKK